MCGNCGADKTVIGYEVSEVLDGIVAMANGAIVREADANVLTRRDKRAGKVG